MGWNLHLLAPRLMPCILIAVASAFVTPTIVFGQEPAVLELQAVGVIKDVTLQLMLIAAGVFSIAGGFYAGDKNRGFVHRWLLWVAFLGLVSSLVFGVISIGVLNQQLIAGHLVLGATEIRWPQIIQHTSLAVGGIVFVVFVLFNIPGRR